AQAARGRLARLPGQVSGRRFGHLTKARRIFHITRSPQEMVMATATMPSEKETYKTTFTNELPITKKVLRAYPADQGHYKPHEKNNTALQIAWTFVVENQIAMAALKGPLKLGGGFPPAPAKFEDVIDAYEKSSKDLVDLVDNTPESRLQEKISFPSG